MANATEAFLSDTVTFLTHPPDAGSVANAVTVSTPEAIWLSAQVNCALQVTLE